jgi:homoserine O-succinyltransferase/O-acetyltransferase
MPLIFTGGRVPPRWAEQRRLSAQTSIDSRVDLEDCLKVALINNMPDPALEDTEIQFFDLLDAACGELLVCIKLYSLPEIVRADRARSHVDSYYHPIQDLLSTKFDGVIITGTEPRQRNLRDEPYWHRLTEVFDWAESHTSSAILSCLAAHASVLHSDNIDRHPLGDKQFGVFEFKKITDHPLTTGGSATVRFPHSRWNEVREYALTSRGYSVLDKSVDGGINLFVKQKQQSLFVHFQGHPEYFSRTLLKEYRRDVRRFLTRERETFPSMPHGYFDGEALRILSEFRKNAEANRQEELMDVFPEAAVSETLQNTWHDSAVTVYRNWLRLLQLNHATTTSVRAQVPATRH